MIIRLFIFFSAYTYSISSAAVLSSVSSITPNEILPIQPVLIYSSAKETETKTETPHQSRALLKDNQIIYIQLLKQNIYRPKNITNRIGGKQKEMKDILYVKALANGQFSHNRLKMYRLPEFYAITVYKMGQLKSDEKEQKISSIQIHNSLLSQ